MDRSGFASTQERMASLPANRPASLLPLLAAVLAGFAAGAMVLVTLNDRAVAVGFVALGLVAAGAVFAARRIPRAVEAEPAVTDWAVAHALSQASDDALAVTDRAGRLICANNRYEALFAGFSHAPRPAGQRQTAVSALGDARRAAWRDGEGRCDGIQVFGAPVSARVARVGEDTLVWRFIGVRRSISPRRSRR